MLLLILLIIIIIDGHKYFHEHEQEEFQFGMGAQQTPYTPVIPLGLESEGMTTNENLSQSTASQDIQGLPVGI